MSSQPVEANVVLTADNTQYDQAMQASSQSTSQLGKTVDGLGEKINKLTKSAGRKMLGITAADVAVITGATAAWASYEKQMTRLQAQAAVTSRTQDQQNKVMKTYTASVKELRSQFGFTTAEAASLTQQISKLADQTKSIKGLADVFADMSMATGESSTGLANSLLNLQKIMGTPQSQTRNYADQLTYLAAKSNTSATALADFSSQLAPMGRAMGMTQTQVTGFANMFSKAGQDGIAAGSAFSKVSQDILQAVQTGSPDLHKYANLLGVTVGQFKEMGGQEQVARFFDQIARLGPKASMELNRFGLDGIRMSKAITGTVQASGGAMNALTEAQIGYSSNATSKGSDAAENMAETMAKMRQDMQQTAEAIGAVFGPPTEKAMKVLEKLASAFQNIMSGPLGKFVALISGSVGAITAAAGAMLLLAGATIKMAAAASVWRSSPVWGVREGLRGGAAMTPQMIAGRATGEYVAAGGEGAYLGAQGAKIAEKGSWGSRFFYNRGQAMGASAATAGRWVNALPWMQRGPEGEASTASQFGGRAIRFGSGMWKQQFEALRYPGPADEGRTQFLQRNFGGRAPEVQQAMTETNEARAKLAGKQGLHWSYATMQQKFGDTSEQTAQHVKTLEADIAALQAHIKTLVANEEALVLSAHQTKVDAELESSETKRVVGTMEVLRDETTSLARVMAEATIQAGKFALVMGAKAVGGVMGALGGPLNAALMGAMMLPIILPLLKPLMSKLGGSKEEVQNYSGFGASYLQAAGVTPQTGPAAVYRASRGTPQSMRQATSMSPLNVAAATAPDYKLNDPALKDLDADQAMALIGTRWSQIEDQPAAVGQVRDDLIAQYGPAQAKLMLTNLQIGGDKLPKLGDYYKKIRAGEDTGKNIGLVGEIAKARVTQAAVTGGPTGAYKEQARGISGMFSQALLAGDSNYDMLDELNKSYGTNISSDMIGDIKTRQQYQSAGYSGQQIDQYEKQGTLMSAETFAKMSKAKQLTYMINKSSDEDAAKLRARFNVPEGVTGDDLTKRIQKTLTARGDDMYTTSGTMQDRIRKQGPAGRMFEESGAVTAALGSEAQNVGQNVKAINEMLESMRSAGMSAPEITKAMGKVQSTFGDPSDPNYILAGMISGQAQQDLALKMPTMTRAEGFSAQVQQFKAIESVKPVTDEQFQNQQDAKNNMAQQLTDQENYFKQMLMMQHQYEIQRKRAQDDYQQQRMWQEQAYALQRSRAEASFNRQRNYAIQDYNRSVKRSNFEFNLQRSRAEADFNHQVMQQAKQMATSVYDVYSRVQEQRTSSASWLIANATDQLKRMQEQEQNLKKLRAEGLSDQAIQTLKLTDPQQAQEAARLVAEMTPAMAAKFNQVAGTARVKAAKALVTDESNPEWEEMRRNERLQMKRGKDDHDRQARIAHDDFFRGLDRTAKEFGIQMAQMDHDQGVAMDHMQITYDTSMKRAAEDVADAGLEISGNLTQILNKSINTLTGHARQQAIEVKKSLTNLRTDTNPIAVAHMQELASIYGFEYKIPKGLGKYLAEQQHPTGKAGTPGGGHSGTQDDPHGAEGGIIPGWTPGRDTVTAHLSGGEAIMRPEWARKVGKDKIDEMNHQARFGGAFWLGGTMPLQNASVSPHSHSQYPFATWAGDLNYPGRADYGKPIVAWRSGIAKPFDLGSDRSYGRGQVIDSGNQSELYAHMSKVLTGLAGKKVQAGQVIGYVGDYGNTGSPPTSHLHFEIRGGKINLSDSDTGTGGTGRAVGISFSDLVKPMYPRAEKAAWNMTGVHPFAPGMMSSILNRMAHRAWKKLDRQYGVAGSTSGSTLGESADAQNAPANVHGAVATGKRMAAAMGWTGNEWDALYQLWQHESGWNYLADNPSSHAHGIPQALPGSKMASAGKDWMTNPATQIKWGLNYIKGRSDYGSPSKAWDLWQSRSPHWYGDGGVFSGPQTIGVGEKGPEAVIPLNDRGADFMSQLMGNDARKIGLHSSPMRGGLHVYNTRIDRSTNFSGPITVQTNDPAEMIHKLQARQRVMALSRPSLTGSAA